MKPIYNLNNNPLSIKNGSYGGLGGNKDGILIDGEEWIIKYPKNLSMMTGDNASYSNSPLSEYLGSHIYEILGYDVHNTILGEKDDKLVVACKDFAVDKMLLEIRTLKNHMGKELADLLDGSPKLSTESHVIELDEILIHLEKNPLISQVPGIKDRFFEQSIVDVFIGNNDRNNGNWGILRERGKADTLAPIFDNGASFLAKASEEKVKRLLESDEIINNAINVLTAYGVNGHSYPAKRYFDAVFEQPEYRCAMKKIVPLIKSKMPEIKNFIYEIPSMHITQSGKMIIVMSEERKNLYCKQMDIRLDKLLEPALNKVLISSRERIETKIGFVDDENENYKKVVRCNRNNGNMER